VIYRVKAFKGSDVPKLQFIEDQSPFHQHLSQKSTASSLTRGGLATSSLTTYNGSMTNKSERTSLSVELVYRSDCKWPSKHHGRYSSHLIPKWKPQSSTKFQKPEFTKPNLHTGDVKTHQKTAWVFFSIRIAIPSQASSRSLPRLWRPRLSYHLQSGVRCRWNSTLAPSPQPWLW